MASTYLESSAIPIGIKTFALAAISYFAFGAMGLSFAISPGYASPIFPAAGLAVALMLWSGNRVWPAIWLGSFILNVSVSLLNGDLSMTGTLVAFTIACGAAMQAFIASRLVVLGVGNAWQDMQFETDIIRCLMLSGVVACIVSATTGVTVLYLAGVISGAAYIESWWNWWVGDTLGVLIVMPIVLSVLYRKKISWRNRFNTVIFPMLAVLLLVAGVIFLVNEWEHNLKLDEIRKQGESFEELLQKRYIAHKEAVAALSRLIEVTPDMSYEQFEYFTRITLKDNADIFALSFNPYITSAQRDAFEKRMSSAGMGPGFQIKESSRKIGLVSAGKRKVYVPVGYIAPLQGNAAAVGFDINSDPTRRAAIEQAIKSGKYSVTAPIHLKQEMHNRSGILILYPAYRNRYERAGAESADNIMGFAVAVIKLDELIKLAAGPSMANGLVYQIDDTTDPVARQVVFRSSQAPAPDTDYMWQTRMPVANRIWNIKVFATDEYLHQQPTPMTWMLSVVGLFFTALLQVLMLVITGRTNIVETKVREQTHELHKKRDELQDINAQLDALFRLSPDGFVAFSSSGKIQFANPAFQAITGISNQSILYQDESVLDLELRKRLAASELFSSVSAYFPNDESLPSQHVLTLHNPSKVVLQMIGMRSDSSNVSRILYLRDITSESEVASIKSEFISHAAHELRTPMTSIFGYIELLLNRSFDESIRREMLEAMQRQASLIVNMINELLDLARIDARGGKDFNFSPVQINTLVSSIVSDLMLEKEGWNIKLHQAENLLTVDGDASKMRQAIMNVLTNAQKYSAPGEEIEISILEQDGCVGIKIVDHGIGMTEEQVRHVGERFWRADMSGSHPGTGLGMSIVKEIVEFHNGRIEISSKPSAGTKVTLWFCITKG